MTDAPAPEVEEDEDEDEKVTTIERFNARIARGVGDAATPVGSMVAWFGPDGKPSHWRPAGAVPFDPFSIIIALFQNDAAVRVYTLPAAIPEPQPKDWKVRRPLRYTLTKAAPTYVVEEMDLTTMADEIIDERVRLAAGMSTADAELERVIDLVELMDPTPGTANVIDRAELLEALEARDHREFDEAPEEKEETEEIVVGAGASAVPAVAPTIPAPAPSPPLAERPS